MPNRHPSTRPQDASRAFTWILAAIAALIVVLQALALGPLRGVMWGSHLYAFLPLPVALAAWVILAAAGVLLMRARPGSDDDAQPGGNAARSIILTALAAVAAGALFWTLRSRQTLLGDAVPLMIDLPGGKAFHPRQPLAMWLQQQCYQIAGGWFRSGDGTMAGQVAARDSVALGSVVAGVVFVPVAHALARLVTRGRGSATAWLVTLVLLTQGYAILFFGYVENYTYQILSIALYLLAALLYLRRRLPLALVAAMLVLAVGIHLSAVSLLPSFVLLVVFGLSERARRVDTVAGLVAVVVLAFVLNRVVGAMSPGYTLWGGIADITNIARTSQGGGAGFSYTFSLRHLRDALSEHILVGPLAALLFIPAAVVGARSSALRRRRDLLFLALCAASFLGGSLLTSEPLLGYARDWDLFAAAGLTYTLAGIAVVVAAVPDTRRLRRLLAFGVVLSLVQLAPWVWINHSVERSIERFATLPLGGGRTETTIANYYFRHDDYDRAETWFKRATEKDPRNPNANMLLGRLYGIQKRYALAAEYLRRAAVVRPDKVSIRKDYAVALLELGRCDDALPNLEWLTGQIPREFDYWHSIGTLASGNGCDSILPAVYRPLLDMLDRYLKSYPDDPIALQHSAIMLRRIGRLDESIARFRRAVALLPNEPVTLFNLGWVLADAGHTEEARSVLQQFLRRFPDHALAPQARETLEGLDR